MIFNLCTDFYSPKFLWGNNDISVMKNMIENPPIFAV